MGHLTETWGGVTEFLFWSSLVEYKNCDGALISQPLEFL